MIMDNEPKYIEGKGWRSETRHSMKRRKPWHDYYQKGTYMLTLVVQDRVPKFGSLCKDGERIFVDLSPLGRAIQETEIKKIHQVYPMIDVWKLCIMPDHLHLILHVNSALPEGKHLGQVVAGFKGGCSRAAATISATIAGASATIAGASAPAKISRSGSSDNGGSGSSDNGAQQMGNQQRPQVVPIFEPGYNDKILLEDGVLDRWKAYLDDNPRRLWVKRQNPTLFTVQHDMEIAGQRCQCFGNHFLLNIPDKVAVIVHRRYSDADNERLKAEWLACGERGGVLISAAISPKEKAILNEAKERGYRVIQLLENGFPPLYKPVGQSFDACAEGLLLQISPWEYHMEQRTISRAQCLELNALAENISKL